jgi:hypothetical protein
MIVDNALVQANCDPECRGRLRSVWMMLMGLSPLVAIPAGALADQYGVPIVVGALGLLVAVVHLGAAVLRPDLRKLR